MTRGTHGSLFSGVGGFELGFDAAGYRTLWQVERDPHCIAVLARRWPDAARYTDVETVNGAELAPVDVVTFGSPCTDLSIAGARAGIHGEASRLFFDAVRIIKEMRDATGSAWPRFAVWENVAGALSSHGGRDFGIALDALAEIGAVAIEWATLDAQFFGVPQRRVRVFVAACFDPATVERSAGELLPHGPRSEGHPVKSRPARAGVTGVPAGRVGSSGGGCDLDFEAS